MPQNPTPKAKKNIHTKLTAQNLVTFFTHFKSTIRSIILSQSSPRRNPEPKTSCYNPMKYHNITSANANKYYKFRTLTPLPTHLYEDWTAPNSMTLSPKTF